MSSPPESLPEPWLRGPIEGVHPLAAPILYTFQQAREDLARHTAALTEAQIWASPHGFGSVGFHLRHIAGSTDRLMTYLQGRPLTPGQMSILRTEHEACGAGRDELLALIQQAFENAEAVVRALDPTTLPEPRWVGRKRLPTTVAGLLLHIAEHTQRHVGQAISAAKWAAVPNSARASAVVYAKNLDRLVQFYARVAGLEIGRTAKDHAVLESESLQLVVVQIPEHIVDTIDIAEPPVRRERTPIKLVFPVDSIVNARDTVSAMGGELNLAEREWVFEGHWVCDGHDPEGNVFQLRAPDGH